MGVTVIDDVDGVATQLMIWGWCVTGEPETSALIAEKYDELVTGAGAWDRTAADLESQAVSYGDEPYRRVKDWAALPWATEHILRGHGDWPGL